MTAAAGAPVVITGLGALTPLGPDVSALEEGLLSGRSGARLLDEPEFADLPARIAATVTGVTLRCSPMSMVTSVRRASLSSARAASGKRATSSSASATSRARRARRTPGSSGSSTTIRLASSAFGLVPIVQATGIPS